MIQPKTAVPAVSALKGDLDSLGSRRSHIIIAFNFGGFKPASFFQHGNYNAGPIAVNIGFTYRF